MKIAAICSSKHLADTIGVALQSHGIDCEHHRGCITLLPGLRAGALDALVLEDCGQRLQQVLTYQSAHGLRRLPVLVYGESQTIHRAILQGATDYATFNDGVSGLVQRLTARIDVQTRQERPETLRVGDFELDAPSQELRIGEKRIALTAREYALARVLFENNGRVVSLETISAGIWGRSAEIGKRTIEQHVHRLRIKLEVERASKTGLRIRAVYGVGYRLDIDPVQPSSWPSRAEPRPLSSGPTGLNQTDAI